MTKPMWELKRRQRQVFGLLMVCPDDFPERRMLEVTNDRTYARFRDMERAMNGDKFLDRPTQPPDVLTIDAARSLYSQMRETTTKTDAAQRETNAIRRDLQRLHYNMDTLNESVIELHNLLDQMAVTDGA